MDKIFPRDDFYKGQELLREYKIKLEEKNLPCIYSTKHFALLIGVEYARLLELIKNRKSSYHCFYVKKKSGRGSRCIMAPDDELKYIQRTIYCNILRNITLSEVCTGFVQKKSIRDNADIHKNKEVVFTIDLYRFFDSIDEKRVYGMFRGMGYEANISYSLAKLCTVRLDDKYLEEIIENKNTPEKFWKDNKNRLPQGAPTSPIIANIIASKLDYRLARLCNRTNAQYSRYADDITISGDRDQIPSFNLIKEIIEEEGFFINFNKVRKQSRGSKQMVTGLTVTQGVHVPRKFKQEIIRHLYYCKRNGVTEHLSYMKKRYKFERYHYKEWLLGKILYIKSIEKEVGERLLLEYNSINWLEYEI